MSLETVRQMVLRYGWNSTAYQVLNPGIHHWWWSGGGRGLSDNAGVVGYVQCGGVTMAAGAPLCPPEELPLVTGVFEEDSRRRGQQVCYFCAASRLEELFRDSRDHAVVAIGAQPVWDPHHWEGIVKGRASLRAQLHRARNKKVVITQEDPEEARKNPAVRLALQQWLASRHMPAMHFMVEPDTLSGVVEDRLLWVARQEERVVGFLLGSPVPLRNGYLLEQIVRGVRAPNGTAELLIDAAMRALAARGKTYATLGLVALAQHAGPEIQKNPLWLRVLMSWARAHGRRFYNFDGLEAFRTKMDPDEWETIYAICNGRRFTPRTLYGIAAAFSNNHPFAMAAETVGRALHQEFTWAKRRLTAA